MSRPGEKSKPPTKSNTSEKVKLEAPAHPPPNTALQMTDPRLLSSWNSNGLNKWW
jgi:hypothetical protein